MSSNPGSANTRVAASECEENMDFSAFKTDIKPIALYPPRFHALQEGNAGLSRCNAWENADDGVDALRKQTAFAKAHGIYGFGLYFSPFSGAQQLRGPTELLLENRDIDMPFFLMYDNGYPSQSTGSGHVTLIQRLKEYTDDKRYIRVGGKPVIGLRGSEEFSVIRKTLFQWRQAARETGIGEIYILLFPSDSAAAESELEGLIDGACAFPSGCKKAASQKQRMYDEESWSFKCLVEEERAVLPASERYDCFRGIVMNWNPSTPQAGEHCFADFSFPVLDLWLKEEIVYSRKYLSEDRRFLFFNGWSRWGEGSYLEPDSQYGYTAVNTLSRAIYGFPYGGVVTPELMVLGTGVPADRAAVWSDRLREKSLVAVQAHVYYDDLIGEVVQYTNNIPVPFDLYVSTNDQEKAERIRKYLSRFSNAVNCVVEVLDNRGRDVIPFLKQMEGHIGKYDYLCHIHTKKSKHDVTMGEVWREYLFENLLGSREIISEILNLFETEEKIGIIFPENLDLLGGYAEWGSNLDMARTLLRRVHCEPDLPGNPIMFPAGDMFWMRARAVYNLFDTDKYEDLIPEEEGQVDGTLMHAMERSWLYLAESNGYSYVITRSITDNRPLIYSEDIRVLMCQLVDSREPAIRAGSKQMTLRKIASEAGPAGACLALPWSIWFLLGKHIPFLRISRPNTGTYYEPRNLARILGAKKSLSLMKTVIRQRLQNERIQFRRI